MKLPSISPLPSILRRWILRLGFIPSISVMVLITVAVSAGLTVLITRLVMDGVSWTGVAISVIVPAVLTLLFGYFQLKLFYQLVDAERKLERLSITDDLTGAYNRRYFRIKAEDEVERIRRYGGYCSLIMMDVDDFKQINDRYGHAAGDKVLEELTRICVKNSRQVDLFARYGGEEFVFMLPSTNTEQALIFAERIRKALAGASIRYGGHLIHFTVSLGVKSFYQDRSELDALLIQADEALYSAKRQGKNRIVAAE